jgi:hypothetical protein
LYQGTPSGVPNSFWVEAASAAVSAIFADPRREEKENWGQEAVKKLVFVCSSKICHGAVCVIAVSRTFGFLYARDFGVSA